MAALQVPGDVKSIKYVDIPALNQVAAVWALTLRSSNDTLTVPGLANTNSVASLTSGISVSAAGIADGENALTITGGSLGTTAVIATLHRVGVSNHLSFDDDPGD